MMPFFKIIWVLVCQSCAMAICPELMHYQIKPTEKDMFNRTPKIKTLKIMDKIWWDLQNVWFSEGLKEPLRGWTERHLCNDECLPPICLGKMRGNHSKSSNKIASYDQANEANLRRRNIYNVGYLDLKANGYWICELYVNIRLMLRVLQNSESERAGIEMQNQINDNNSSYFVFKLAKKRHWSEHGFFMTIPEQ